MNLYCAKKIFIIATIHTWSIDFSFCIARKRDILLNNNNICSVRKIVFINLVIWKKKSKILMCFSLEIYWRFDFQVNKSTQLTILLSKNLLDIENYKCCTELISHRKCIVLYQQHTQRQRFNRKRNFAKRRWISSSHTTYGLWVYFILQI